MIGGAILPQLSQLRSGIESLNPLSGNGVELAGLLLLSASLILSLCESGLLIPPTNYLRAPYHRPQHEVSLHGLAGYFLQYAGHRWFSGIALNVHYPTLGLIFVLSLVSIIFIWTEYSYLQSKSALIVVTPILLTAVLLIFLS